MSLRLVDKQRSYPVTACDTVFDIISMSIGEKEKLIYDLMNVGSENGAFDRLLDVITPNIIHIEGNDGSTREILEQMEDIEQLREIVQAIIRYCSLTKDEVKNSLSSLEQPIPVSAGNADQSV